MSERAISVDSMTGWKKALPQLGHDGVVAVSWQVVDPDRARAIHTHMLERPTKARGRIYIRPERIPAEYTEPAFEAAEFSGRIALTASRAVTCAPFIRGDDRKITSLHADIHQGLPAITTLAVLSGSIETRFKLLDLAFTGPKGKDMLGDFIDETCEDHEDATAPGARHKMHRIRDERLDDFLPVVSHAGEVLAFPAAGDAQREIQPTAHEVRSLTEQRHTLPLLDINFAKYHSDHPDPLSAIRF
jgi:hypothetical protein